MTAASERSATWRWGICGLLLLATMLNYMDRQTLSQSATDISRDLVLSNEDYGRLEQGFGFAFAAGGVVLGFVADKVSLRWLYPAVLLAWSAAGFATGSVRSFESLMVCRVVLGFFEAGQWPCALSASQRLLPSRDRALGNSVLQSGAAIGAIATPLVVQALVSEAPGSWRAPFRVIGVLGVVWIAVWLVFIRRGDLDRGEPGKSGAPEVSTTTRSEFVRRLLVLIVIVVAINLCWHFYRAWMPKMLRESYGYSRGAVNYYTSAFYIATDVGCIAAGVATTWLASRGWSVHRSRLVTFLVCALLTALSTVAAVLPAGPALLVTLLVIAAGALGLFPIYYSLSQELSSTHQGKVTGTLGCVAWVASALMQRYVGRWLDQSGSYAAVLFASGLLPLVALLVLAAFWGRSEGKTVPKSAPADRL
ncbi:MAG: MFS transporter [Isosphaeraceae bacterium]|nr:MFS transporter [Isosphaeraceae bacterium]